MSQTWDAVSPLPLGQKAASSASPRSPTSGSTSSVRDGSSTRGLPSKRAGNLVSAACNACRKHKAKCSGERPACERCVKTGKRCLYTTMAGETPLQALKRNRDMLRDESDTQSELLKLLNQLPEDQAIEYLRQMRSGVEPAALVSRAQAGDPINQLVVVPESRFRYDFPYRSEMPREYMVNNPYLGSLIYEAASLYSSGQRLRSHGSLTSSLANLNHAEHRDIYTKPFHAAQVVDPLVSNVRPSLWTSVSKDDNLMRDLLKCFFRNEYFFTSAFQKDRFLEDMIKQQADFCSPLLVNIILALACTCYRPFENRAEYWNPTTLLYRFLSEAKRLWEVEARIPKLTTIQAGIIFNVIYNLCGIDEIGQVYRINSIALAHKLRLFDEPIFDQDERIRQGKVYTAWAVFSWEALVAFSFVQAPLLTTPPYDPLPHPSIDPSFYGEVWLHYPLSLSPTPSAFGHMFRSRAHFRIIMCGICDLSYGRGKDIGVTLDTAYRYYAELTSWYNSLPLPLMGKTIALPTHLQLHMYYHHLILTLFEPLLDSNTSYEPSPRQLVRDASVQLHTLLRLYYLRHGYDAMDLYIVIPLVLAGFKALDAIEKMPDIEELETLRSTLILVANGLYNQRRNHYLAEVLYRVVRGRMRPEEARLLRSTMDLTESENDERHALRQQVRSHWPVSVVKRKEDLDAHILANLVESMSIEDT